MPYSKKRRTFKRRNGSRAMHKVARQEARKVIRREVETKTFDGSTDTAALTTVSAFGSNYLCTASYPAGAAVPIVQGIDNNMYLGTKIRPVGLALKYSVNNDEIALGDSNNTMTVIIFQGRGSFVPSFTSSASQLTYNGNILVPFSPINVDFNSRLKVLYRKIISVDDYNITKNFHVNIPAHKLRPMEFTDTVGSIESNTLFICVASDSVAATHPTIRMTWRLYYKDA